MDMKRGRYPNIDLQKGHSRRLYNSEIYRGFLFITGSKQRGEYIDDEGITVLFQDLKITNKRMDKAGRIHLGTPLFEKIEFNSIVNIKILNRKTIRVTFNQGS